MFEIKPGQTIEAGEDIGMLPSPRGAFTTLETVPVPELTQTIEPVESAPIQVPLQTSERPVVGRGDWRQATANIQDYLSHQLKTARAKNVDTLKNNVVSENDGSILTN